VGTGGLFGGFAHEHLIEAQKIDGCANIDSSGPAKSSIKVIFPTANLRVIDPKESDKDRAQIQKTMETDVLRVSEYPEITFESTAIETSGMSDELRVHGKLTIRDKTMAVDIPVKFTRQANGTYLAAGNFRFKQSSFGIRPIQLVGGTVKVKDELQTEFELLLK
jgi:polyisoprenoid-binding protein YceI